MRVTHRAWLIVKSIVSADPPLLVFSPLTARVQYLRVTLNWVTISFFIFSFAHCFTQGTLQAFIFNADDAWGVLTTEIVNNAQLESIVFTQFTGRRGNYSLELCDQVPVVGGNSHPCDHFFTAGQSDPITIPPRFLPQNSSVVGPDDSAVRQSSFVPCIFC